MRSLPTQVKKGKVSEGTEGAVPEYCIAVGNIVVLRTALLMDMHEATQTCRGLTIA